MFQKHPFLFMSTGYNPAICFINHINKKEKEKYSMQLEDDDGALS